MIDPNAPASSVDYWQRRGHFLHLRTQRDQPYGSERRCCERCGVMVWPEHQGRDTPFWTDDPDEYARDEYRCDRRAALNAGDGS